MASNAERLEAIYEGFWRRGDWHAGAEIMAPDIEWNGFGDSAFGDTFYGPRAVNKFFADWIDTWEAADVDWQIEEITPDLLLVMTHLTTRGRESGFESETMIGQVWEFRDGLAVRQTMYRDPEDARRAVREMTRGDGG